MAEDIKYMAKWIEGQSLKTIDNMKRALVAGGMAVQGKARTKCPVNTGNLRQSIISTANFLKGDMEVIIGPTAQYGAFVEFGTMPHKTSQGHKEFVEGIKRWAFLHNLPWYPIYRKIVKNGTKGRPYLIPAFNEVEPKVNDKLEQILKETGENG